MDTYRDAFKDDDDAALDPDAPKTRMYFKRLGGTWPTWTVFGRFDPSMQQWTLLDEQTSKKPTRDPNAPPTPPTIDTGTLRISLHTTPYPKPDPDAPVETFDAAALGDWTGIDDISLAVVYDAAPPACSARQKFEACLVGALIGALSGVLGVLVYDAIAHWISGR